MTDSYVYVRSWLIVLFYEESYGGTLHSKSFAFFFSSGIVCSILVHDLIILPFLLKAVPRMEHLSSCDSLEIKLMQNTFSVIKFLEKQVSEDIYRMTWFSNPILLGWWPGKLTIEDMRNKSLVWIIILFSNAFNDSVMYHNEGWTNYKVRKFLFRRHEAAWFLVNIWLLQLK